MTSPSQLALDLPAAPPPPKLRVLDIAESEATDCADCGGPAEYRLYRGVTFRDYCESCACRKLDYPAGMTLRIPY